MHSLFRFKSECKWKILQVSIPSIQKSRNGFAESGCFHSSSLKTQEWFLIKQAISILRSCAGPPQLVARRHLPGRKAESGAEQSSLAMPLRRTPRAMNCRCHRKATPSEGSTYRSELVERSRMCPREGERSPRAYSEEQGAAQALCRSGGNRLQRRGRYAIRLRIMAQYIVVLAFPSLTHM